MVTDFMLRVLGCIKVFESDVLQVIFFEVTIIECYSNKFKNSLSLFKTER